MVRRTTTRYDDDIDGSPDAEPITFSVLGRMYEIDLSEENTARLMAALEPFIAHARRPVGGRDLSKDARGTRLRD